MGDGTCCEHWRDEMEYRIEEDGDMDGIRTYIMQGDNRIAEMLELDRAQLMVNACNTHKELLEALKGCLLLIKDEWTGTNDRDLTPDGTIGIVEKLIAKAEGR